MRALTLPREWGAGGGLRWAGVAGVYALQGERGGVQHWGSFPAGQTSASGGRASDRRTTPNPGVGDGKKGGGLR